MKIDYHKKFVKVFKKLPHKIKSRFYDRLRLFEKNQFDPILGNHSVDPIYPGWRSIDITGDYRALFDPKGDDMVIFMKIGTHSELYR